MVRAGGNSWKWENKIIIVKSRVKEEEAGEGLLTTAVGEG